MPLVVDTTTTYDDSSEPGGAKCGALGGTSNSDADLAALLKIWPALSDGDRLAIMAIIGKSPLKNHP